MSSNIKTYEQFNEADPYNEERWNDDEDLIDIIHGKLKISLNAWMPVIVTMTCDGDYIYIRYIETRKFYHVWIVDGNIEVTEFELGKRENKTEFDKTQIDECVEYITDTIVAETEKTMR